MEHYQETPQATTDLVVCGLAAALLATGGAWQLKVALAQPDTVQVWRFLAVALGVAGLLYLAWVAWSLRRVSYGVQGQRLLIRQGRRRIEVPLRRSHLHRWRGRWTWSDTAQQDLQVAALTMCPPIWFTKPGMTWVITYEAPGKVRRAVAFRPSQRLVAMLRQQAVEQTGA